jgi:magnesium chelatase subunit D
MVGTDDLPPFDLPAAAPGVGDDAFDEAGALAAMALALLAVAPHAVGGALVRAAGGEESERWTKALRGILPPDSPVRRLPAAITDDRLLGGLDLAATLSTGRPVAERGLLAEADGGVVIVPGAERATRGLVSRLACALDRGEIPLLRDGVADVFAARAGVIALDERMEDDEAVSPALIDRLAFVVGVPARWDARDHWLPSPDEVADARARYPAVMLPDDALEAIVGTAAALGVDSLRAPQLALRAARASAALGGRDVATVDDLQLAAKLVLAPRATRIPAPPQEEEPPPEDQPPPPPPDGDDTPRDEPPPDDPQDKPIEDLLVEAAAAAIPKDLLELLAAGKTRGGEQGRVGGEQKGAIRGRQIGSRHGIPRGGKRLHVLDTLRGAAPWQKVRRRTRGVPEPGPGERPDRVEVRREDFKVRRFVEKTGTTVVMAVDASGSSALARFNEAKGAVERLLAESYARRDKVALVAFRGTKAELLLPPTRALARARRVLTGLPGGGGTPLASAIDLVTRVATQAMRDGSAVLAVFLTDARANIARDGQPGRPRAEADALESSRALAAARVPALFIDTSPRGERVAKAVAEAMRARYLLLPNADAATVTTAVKTMVT